MSSAVAWVAGLSPARRVERLVLLEARIARLQAEQLELIAAMASADEATADPLARDWTVEEIAAALRRSPGSARNRLAVARFVVSVPVLLAALRSGAVSLLQVLAAERELRHCNGEQRVAVVERVLPRAPSQTVGEFGSAVRGTVLRMAAANAAARCERARADRGLSWRAAPDGMTDVWARLPAEQAAAAMARVDADARTVLPGDPRTVAQRRADAFVTRLLGTATATVIADDTSTAATGVVCGGLPGGLAPQVFVAFSTLTGADDQPGELAGYGPIPAALARALAFDPTGTWRGVLTDHSGALLDTGRRTYRPPAALDRFVRTRDRTCRFP